MEMVARQPVPRKRSAKKASHRSSSLVLVLIGIFKLVKAVLLILAGVAALNLLHRDIPDALMHWTRVLRVDPDNRIVHRVLVRLLRVTPRQLSELSVGTFVYATLFSIEGVGLLLRKRWAEYFTIVTTGGLIPLEIFELARHFSAAKAVVLFVNVLIVLYLVARVRGPR
jgi:uncharacterized membrane protein (DUF2068 family)